MEITNLPILDYLEFCRNTARSRGYLWVMVLLARKRDSQESYNDIKKYWNSYNDLTHNRILFLFSNSKNHKFDDQNGLPCENLDYIRVNNPNLSIVNNYPPAFSKNTYFFDTTINKYRINAIDNNENYITDIRDAYNINENCIPSIILFPTDWRYENQRIVIPISDDNLYNTIKNFISFIDKPFKDMFRLRAKLDKICDNITKTSEEMMENKITSKEIHFLKAQNYLSQEIFPGLSKEEKNYIDKIITNRDKEACNQFKQPLLGV